MSDEVVGYLLYICNRFKQLGNSATTRLEAHFASDRLAVYKSGAVQVLMTCYQCRNLVIHYVLSSVKYIHICIVIVL